MTDNGGIHLRSPSRKEHRRLWRGTRRLLNPAWCGLLWRTNPLSSQWGFDRGTPIDRYYIEQFLAKHASDIRGSVLEVQNSNYIKRFGTAVERFDILDIDASNPKATLIADLTRADNVASDSFDCLIITQTLHLIYDVQAALLQAHRILRPGGVLLATLPVISRLSARAAKSEFWRFTPASAERLFGEVFGKNNIYVQSDGNVLSAVAFLTGLAQEDLTRDELDINDAYFPVVVSIRAVKTAS